MTAKDQNYIYNIEVCTAWTALEARQAHKRYLGKSHDVRPNKALHTPPLPCTHYRPHRPIQPNTAKPPSPIPFSPQVHHWCIFIIQYVSAAVPRVCNLPISQDTCSLTVPSSKAQYLFCSTHNWPLRLTRHGPIAFFVPLHGAGLVEAYTVLYLDISKGFYSSHDVTAARANQEWENWQAHCETWLEEWKLGPHVLMI